MHVYVCMYVCSMYVSQYVLYVCCMSSRCTYGAAYTPFAAFVCVCVCRLERCMYKKSCAIICTDILYVLQVPSNAIYIQRTLRMIHMLFPLPLNDSDPAQTAALYISIPSLCFYKRYYSYHFYIISAPAPCRCVCVCVCVCYTCIDKLC